MIDTRKTDPKNFDDLIEKEETIRENFKPDFTVYTQSKPSVSM